jgi:uncharacterized protein
LSGDGPRLIAAPTRIEGRSAGGWVVAGRIRAAPLLVTATRAETLCDMLADSGLAALDAGRLPPLDGVELLLLGTGPGFVRPPERFVAGARARGLRVEAMDSAAAARTFNILLGEERRVAALLL